MTRPSWQDFGTHDESAYPELWDGVVGAWAPSLGPTGLRLHDHSRRGNWGTLTNMDPETDWVVDGGQYALDFDGIDDYVSCGTTPDVFGSGVSIVATVNLTSSSSFYYTILSTRRGSDNATPFSFDVDRFNATKGALRFYLNNGGFNIWTSTQTISSNSLATVGVSYASGSDPLMAINGIAATVNRTSGAATPSILYTATTMSIAAFSGLVGSDKPWLGQICDVRLYNRKLSIQELLQHTRRSPYELAPRRRSSAQVVTGNRRRRLLIGAH